jgi:putative RecB family exonuclease
MFEVPTGLSPSRVESFTSCPLAFRFVNIQHLAEAPSIHATRGSLVHRALELAFAAAPADRTPDRFRRCLDLARLEYRSDPEFVGLGLDDEGVALFDEECRTLVDTYLTMEDPRAVHPIGLELRLSASVGALSLRGIIDRLELRDDELVVTDYKTGRSPSLQWEQRSLAGVHFYSFLCWEAVERACTTGDFRPRPSARCASCGFQAWCPSFGGDPDRAEAEAPHTHEALLVGVAGA